MREMKKLIIEERIDKVDNLIEEKEADQLIDLINNWKKTFGNFKLKFESYGHDGGYDIILYQIREETDSEYKTRIEKIKKFEDAKREKAQKEKEIRLQQYLKLKKEFEK